MITNNPTITLQNGRTLEITCDPLSRPFCIGVPHQRPAFLAFPDEHPPIEEDGDRITEGDHDLSGCYLVETLDDARPLLNWKDERGGQSRHQAIRVSVLVVEELVAQGMLAEIDSEE